MSYKIKAKYIIRASLKSVSPFLIASGESEEADKDAVLLPNGQPYIPASSIAGVLRHLFDKKGIDEKVSKYLWGTKASDNEDFQSHLIIDNLVPVSETEISIRDGVKINSEKGTAEEGSKYDYQLVEPEVAFNFQAEATLREEIDESEFDDAIIFLGKLLQSKELRIGALSGFGFGKLNCEDIEIYKFNFPDDADAWFAFVETDKLSRIWKKRENLGNEIQLIKNQFKIKGQFKLKTSLLTATYGVDPTQPDKTQLMSNEKFVLSGKSIKGALRHRALKIWSTQMPKKLAEKKLKEMMGWVESENPDEKASKSRLRVEEAIINRETAIAQEQPRIKINRFEGGAIPSALFSSEAIWNKNDREFEIMLTLNEYQPEEAVLLLQLLKDLWTGDLAIGGEKNIGRGLLIGKSAEILWDENRIKFQSDKEGNIRFIEGGPEDLIFEK